MAIDSPKNDFAEKHRFLTYADEPDTVYDGSKIMDGSVTTDKIADYAVTTDKIDDESITTVKLDDGIITADKLATDVLGMFANVEKNIPSDITKDNQNIFVENDKLSVTDNKNNVFGSVVYVNEDLSLKSAIAAGMVSTFNVNGTSDYCEAMALVGTYLSNASNFYYGNAYTGTTYEGTYDSPVAIDPKQHKTDGKMPIDCATFTTLIGNGCTFQNSIYQTDVIRNRPFHEMYNPVGGMTKPYWKYNPKHENIDANVGYGRVLSDAQAKMFFDAGVLSSIDETTEQLQIGDIVFSGTDAERFMRITHCSVVSGCVDYTMAGMIVAESTSTTESAITTKTIADANIAIRAKISPNYNAGNRLHNSFAPYIFSTLNRNLSTNPITWNADTGLGEILPKVIAITSKNSNRRTVHVTATNGTSTINKDIQFYGTRLLFLPYGWSVTLTSTETDTFNIVQQKCGTDKAIIVLPRSFS